MSELPPEEKRAKGRQLYERMLGADKMKGFDAGRNAFNAPIQDYIMENCFGDVWQGKNLDPKIRSIMCIAMLTALGGMGTEIKNHVRTALHHGCTADEMREVILQLIPYCGMPRMGAAMAAADEVLKERNLI